MKKTALITGASRGLGFALAKTFFEHGYTTIGITRRNMDKDIGLDIIWKTADIENTEILDSFYKGLLKEFGTIDVLINNAGIYVDDIRKVKVDLLSLDIASLEKTLKVNYLSAFASISAIFPHMVSQKHGRIINISSGMGRLDQFDSYSYAYRASKLLMNTLTISYGKVLEEMDVDIAVTSVCPGWMQTDMGTSDGIYAPEYSAQQIYNLVNLEKEKLNGMFYRNGERLDFCSKNRR